MARSSLPEPFSEEVVVITEIDGIKAQHAIITPICIANRGIEGAIDEALRRIRQQFLKSVEANANASAKFHVVLTVDRDAENRGAEP
jgi:hypothetical protein